MKLVLYGGALDGQELDIATPDPDAYKCIRLPDPGTPQQFLLYVITPQMKDGRHIYRPVAVDGC